jgi:hypothetical protein
MSLLYLNIKLNSDASFISAACCRMGYLVSRTTYPVTLRSYLVSRTTYPVTPRSYLVSRTTYPVTPRSYLVSRRTYLVSRTTFIANRRSYRAATCFFIFPSMNEGVKVTSHDALVNTQKGLIKKG